MLHRQGRRAFTTHEAFVEHAAQRVRLRASRRRTLFQSILHLPIVEYSIS